MKLKIDPISIFIITMIAIDIWTAGGTIWDK